MKTLSPLVLLLTSLFFSACWINKSNGQSRHSQSLQTEINLSFPGTFGVAIKCFAGVQGDKYQECYEDDDYRTCFTKRIDGMNRYKVTQKRGFYQ